MRPNVEEITTLHGTMRIRIKTLPPPGEMDEYDLRRFLVGDVYDTTAQLASLLIVGGYAEPVSGRFHTATAADSNRHRKA